MFNMIGGVGVRMRVLRIVGENGGWRIDTSLEHEIFITLRIRHNDKDRKNNAMSL